MIREDRFLISRKPYAVDLSSLRTDDPRTGHDGSVHVTATLDAVWFRRRKGVTVACVGDLWDIQAPPADATAFLAAHDDGRYGGTCHGRWDGENYWGAQKPDRIDATWSCCGRCSTTTRRSPTAGTGGTRSPRPADHPAHLT